ncbi:MAG: hypothetical protein ACREGB_04215, partial [Candidatus Saccharimonadales bacterium]
VQLYIIGYPQVITHGQCGLNVQLDTSDIDMAQNLIAYLDWTIQQAANSVGARYVDTQGALVGHRLCEATQASMGVNGLTAGNDTGPLKILGSESYHPTVLGHQLLAQAILSQTSNLKAAMPAADSSITPPNQNDPLALALLGNYPNSGHVPPAQVVHASNVTSDVVYRSLGASMSLGASFGLKPDSPYQVDIDGQGVVGSFSSDASGSLNFTLPLPATMPTGYRVVAISGVDRIGQTLQVQTIVYVAASQTDLDGDGVPNDQESCLIVPDSGVDADGDGIDDACDPVIGNAPQQDYQAKVYLKNNTILITRP